METLLRRFNGDKKTKEALLAFLVGFFEEKIIERAMKKEDTKSLVDAISELRRGFDQLETDYGIKKEPKKPIDQAR